MSLLLTLRFYLPLIIYDISNIEIFLSNLLAIDFLYDYLSVVTREFEITLWLGRWGPCWLRCNEKDHVNLLLTLHFYLSLIIYDISNIEIFFVQLVGYRHSLWLHECCNAWIWNYFVIRGMGTTLTKVEWEGPWDFLAKYAMRCTIKVSNGTWATIVWSYWHFMSFVIMVWKIGYVCSNREPEPSSSLHLWLQTNSLVLPSFQL